MRPWWHARWSHRPRSCCPQVVLPRSRCPGRTALRPALPRKRHNAIAPQRGRRGQRPPGTARDRRHRAAIGAL